MSNRFLSVFIICLPLLTILCSCAPEPVQVEKERPLPPKPVSADEYLLNLSLAKFELEEGTSYQDIKSRMEIIEAYANFKKQTKKKEHDEKQTVAIFEFKRKSNDKSRFLLVPLSGKNDGMEPLLKQATEKIQDKGFVILNIKLAEIASKRSEISNFFKKGGNDIYTKVNSQMDYIMKSRKNLDLLKTAQIHMYLCDFFMQIKFRDAAYISIENAKQALALAVETKETHKEELVDLVSRINTLEVDLYKNMPFAI